MTTAPRHTPGPWEVPVEGRIRGANGEYLWHIEDYDCGTKADVVRMHADAKLIAAAPKMYALLEELADSQHSRDPLLVHNLAADAADLLAAIDGGPA